MGLLGAWLLDNGGILMSGISGIFSFFSAGKKGRVWQVLPIAGVVLGMLWALESASFQEREQDQKQEQKTAKAIQDIDDYVKGQTDRGVSETESKMRLVMQQFFGALPAVAQDASAQQVSATFSAATTANTIIQSLPADRRAALTIKVFDHVAKDLDYDVVKSRLLQLADKVDLVTPREQQAPVNSVWYGDGVTLEEAKAAALIVSSAGTQIRQICASKLVKIPNLIQIGGSTAASHAEVLSISRIQGLSQPVCP